MKIHLLITVSMLTLFSEPSWSRFSNDTEYEDCILENMQGIDSDAVAKFISSYCSHITSGHFQVSNHQLNYEECVLENVAGNESDKAFESIDSACRRLNTKFRTQ